MEREWIETVQFLGLDMMVGLIVVAVAASALWPRLVGLLRTKPRLSLRRRVGPPTSPRDVYATEEWGPSH